MDAFRLLDASHVYIFLTLHTHIYFLRNLPGRIYINGNGEVFKERITIRFA